MGMGMGKRIDRAALRLACAVGYYLFFLNAWGSIPLACGAAFLACAATGKLLEGLPRRQRASRSQAREMLSRVAAMDDGEAEALLTRLIGRRYPGEAFRLTPVLKHPEATLSSGDILNAWKANRDAERLVIAATCPCEPRAAQYARELAAPAVAVVDSRALLRLLRDCPDFLSPAAPRTTLRVRLRRALARIASVRVSPKNLLLAVAMLAAYLFAGSPFNLFAALILLAHAGIAVSHRKVGKKLFDA